MDTTYQRNRSNELVAKTVLPLGSERRELHIETRKGIRGGLQTSASVHQVSEDGLSRSHAFGLGRAGGDFRRTLAEQADKRATEKAIRTQHEAALTNADAVLIEARAHYAQASV